MTPTTNTPPTRIHGIFDTLARDRRSGLMPYVTAGYPTLTCTESVVLELADAGASVIELGFPFTDPIADGPTIAASMHAALEGGVTPEAIFAMVSRLRGRVSCGLISMVSMSIVHRHGIASFVETAAKSGFDGLIVPDVDLSSPSFETLAEAVAGRNLSLGLLVAPSTTPVRCREIVGACRDFVYLITRDGVTGESADAPRIAEAVQMIRSIDEHLPIAAGFGISRREHVREVTNHADAAIVGSAIVRALGAEGDVEAVGRLARDLVEGLARHQPSLTHHPGSNP